MKKEPAVNTHSTNAALASNENRDLQATTVGLLYGIACIQSLPKERQERETMFRMCAIVRETAGPKLAFTLWGVETLVGREIDLWPDGGGSFDYGFNTEEEDDHKTEVRDEIEHLQMRFERTGALIDAPPSDVIRFF